MNDRQYLCPDCGSPLPAGVGALLCPVCTLSEEASSAEETLTISDYTLVREIARGGMGVVYEARQNSLQRTVALKILPGAIFSSAEFRQRFQREAETAARLNHPGIVAIHEVGQHHGQPFIVMELVQGQSLADRLQQGRMTTDLAAHIVREVAYAVAHAHERGVIHRDLKPSNILLRAETEPVLTDFGLARFLDTGQTLTRSAQSLGSPGYLPPERACKNNVPPSVAEDVYGLGAVLYHCLSGRPPFVADSVVAVLTATQMQEPVPLRWLNSSVPRDLETLCLRCLEKQPSARYANAMDVAAELDRYLKGEPVLARPVGPVMKLWKHARRQPMMAALILALVLTIFSGLTASILGWQRASHEAMRRRVELYSSQMAAAAAALNTDHPAQARALLEGLKPAEHEIDLRGPEWRVLHHLLMPLERQALPAHSHIVTSLAWSPDGGRLATGAHHGELKLWKLTGDRLLQPECELIAAGKPRLHQVEWISQDRLLVAEEASVIRCRSAVDGHVLWEIPGRQFGYCSATRTFAVSSGGPFFYEPAGRVTLWDCQGDAAPRQRQGWAIPGRAVALSASGRYLAVGKVRPGTGDSEQGISLHDLTSPAAVPTTFATSGSVWSLRFSPDEGQLAATLFQGSTSVLLFNVRQGQALPSLTGHKLRPWSVTFDANGQAISSSSDRTLRVWSDGLEAARVTGAHENEIWSLALHSAGRLIATGDKDGVVKLFDYPLPQPRLAALPLWPHQRYETLAFMPDSGQIILSPSNKPRRVQLLTGNAFSTFPPSGSMVGHDDQSRLWLWDEATQRLMAQGRPLTRELAAPKSAIGRALKIILPMKSHHVVGVHAPGIITRVDLDTGAATDHPLSLRQPLSKGDSLKAFAASEDGRYVAAATWHELALHDFTTGRTTLLSNDPHWARDIAFSPEGRVLATAGIDGHIHVRQLPEGRLIQTLNGHLEEASGLAFSPDGRTLVSIEIGLGLRFWRTDTWREVLSLPLKDAAEGLRFSPDGRWLAILLCQPGVGPERAQVMVMPTGN